MIFGHLCCTRALLWRLCGVKEISVIKEESGGDPRLVLAKQYIADNIELAPTISDISAYCHISTKQLGRLFVQAEGITPAAYIQKQRTGRIETPLRSGDLSLRCIRERMHFSSEYILTVFSKTRRYGTGRISKHVCDKVGAASLLRQPLARIKHHILRGFSSFSWTACYVKKRVFGSAPCVKSRRLTTK